ncbi:MAG TPA: hypothetical protein DCY48_03570 [Candidatus Magasanikbacteria bacterium]|nr:MAG: hypothetical protein A3I74_04705 [Candidatus Magasanikbacteria bacterium RIFCSPLOWO2_02_FULL_47_16]OGH79506.1 MAG: hypothetical protein A3C10_01675 [Candidatus Magasanikbacteria bacterium RIFCSPHIGHO2_02_FULL_48_18]OGH81960.1 MAG: hypothetical protein A3G08_02015 [Candidatus Magasanikbacteria bacterium RIFCSPLOWO2_12_FULL_47_9b]HAZ28823.1 hypothetical protein [Candidatus Magasanikbacteria bacterium]
MSFSFLDNMYCGAIRRGDVVLYEEEPREERAYVALQDTTLNETLGTIVCVGIEPTEDHGRSRITEVVLKKNETGLGKDGLCVLSRIMPIDRRFIVAKKAELHPELFQKLLQALDIVLGRFRDRA